ncbi:MAG: phosphoribosylaminoimidazole carboxylase [Clostridiales bacterium]|jgi:5-(carboxyamino)imidazole ribonucleotide mutase|nr:phosphoribosylaminoimidazole carboxylase [Clostridiales bacterium]
MLKVGIVMGSDSDLPVVKKAVDILEKFKVEYEIHIASAHRTPQKTAEFARNARDNGIGVIIAAAGGAAHLPGVIAAETILPVVGIPIKTSTLGGVDSLYSIVQMPKGIPVAGMAINGAENAALFAVQILSLGNPEFFEKMKEYRAEMAQQVEEKDSKLQELGPEEYLKSSS